MKEESPWIEYPWGFFLHSFIYGELATGTRPTGKHVRFEDVCKRGMKTGNINSAKWETQAADRSSWRTAIRTSIHTSDKGRREQWGEKKEHKKQMAETTAEPGAKTFKCSNCNRVCDSTIGLYSHSRHCNNP